MKVSAAALALSATAWSAVIPQQELLVNRPVQNVIHHEPAKFLIELAPYQTRWVTEEEKWALKLVRLGHTSSLSGDLYLPPPPALHCSNDNWE